MPEQQTNGTTQSFTVSNVQLRFVENGRDGLLAWASCVINKAVYLNNIAVRNNDSGGIRLTYPAKASQGQQRFYYFNPVNREAAAAVEQAVREQIHRLLPQVSTANERGRAQ